MQINIIQHRPLRTCAVAEGHMIKINGAIGNFHNCIRLRNDRTLFAQHLADTLRTLFRKRNHNEDHRDHHQRNKDLETVGQQR